MTPGFRIEFDGTDITGRIKPFLMDITLTDKRGLTADDLTLRLTDLDARLQLPSPGSQIKLWLGDEEAGLVFKGLFTVDELESSGPPDHISLKAGSADFTAGIKVKKDTFYENKTIGDIVSHIAGEHELSHKIAEPLAGIAIEHRVQNGESDLNFLSRLAKDYGGWFALKNAHLLFLEEAAGDSASGADLPVFTLDRAETSSFRFTERSRENKFTGARAFWYDTDNGGTKIYELVGEDTRVKSLTQAFEDSDAARSAAEAEWARTQRGEMTLSAQLSRGDAALIPDRPVSAIGFKPSVNALPWTIASVTHRLGQVWFSSDIELEVKSTSPT